MRKFIVAVFLFSLIASSSALAGNITRPSEGGKPTEISMLVYVLDVDEINTVGQNFTANVFFEAQWHDERLAHKGPGKITKSLDEVWNPNIQILNQQRVWSTFPEAVKITPEGDVKYSQRIWGSFSQPLKLKEFPFDRQTFKIMLLSPGYSPEKVKFIQDSEFKSGMGESFSIADWVISNWKVEIKNVTHANSRSNASSVFILSFEGIRQHLYYIVKVITPLIFIVFMSWIVFWIDPKQSGTQISVAVTAMLTLIAYQFITGMTLPKIAYLTRLDHFNLAASIMIFSALVEVTISSWLARNDKLFQARRLDLVARWLFPIVFILAFLKTLVFGVNN